jgi:thioredoxin 1
MTTDEPIEEIRKQKVDELRDPGSDTGTPDESPQTPDRPVAVQGASELNEAVDAYGVVLVDFYADWCGPCQMIEPVVERIAADTDAAVAKVDVDANQPLAAEYGVRGVPTLLLFADDEPVERLVGMQEESQLRSLVESYA